MDEWKEDKPINQSTKGTESFGWDSENVYI